MQALHQWFLEPCPDRHRLQTSWHILRVFPSPAGPETLGRAQQNCCNMLQIQFDGHCSTRPQISCTSSATLTISYCPGLLLLPEKKKKIKEDLWRLATPQSTTHHHLQLHHLPRHRCTHSLPEVPSLVHLTPASLLLK